MMNQFKLTEKNIVLEKFVIWTKQEKHYFTAMQPDVQHWPVEDDLL